MPAAAAGVAPFCNRVLVRLWGIRHLALANFVLARPIVRSDRQRAQPSGVGHRAGAKRSGQRPGDLRAHAARWARGTELIFVEGHSCDDTYGAIERALAANPAAGTRGCSGRPAAARATPCAWDSPRRPATS